MTPDQLIQTGLGALTVLALVVVYCALYLRLRDHFDRRAERREHCRERMGR